MPFHGSEPEGLALLEILRLKGGSATTAELREALVERGFSPLVNNAAASLRKWARRELGAEDALECEYVRTYTDARGRRRKVYRYTLSRLAMFGEARQSALFSPEGSDE